MSLALLLFHLTMAVYQSIRLNRSHHRRLLKKTRNHPLNRQCRAYQQSQKYIHFDTKTHFHHEIKFLILCNIKKKKLKIVIMIEENEHICRKYLILRVDLCQSLSFKGPKHVLLINTSIIQIKKNKKLRVEMELEIAEKD
ncbi:hypothetical protein BpHYR1_003758 [Brachionus plicatilis]|uniref:Uncharacterized protein n=1 Tax=Brachionus plicatilis TaxID=10195 RepID=A0A3M7SNV8_BRAPC|nr:hypothetical protein BpHYR1_003758 [Brachionus plicatilis]